MAKVRVLNNLINKGWNVGDHVEIDDPKDYEGFIEVLEENPPKGSGKPPKELEEKVFKPKKRKK